MRYTGPVCRLCRREGVKLFLKGERCNTVKCAIERGRPAPGASSQYRRAKLSDYGEQLRAKQKIRRFYSVSERQFVKAFKEASKKRGRTSFELILMMERRLDNIVYRLGIAPSRAAARQMVAHGHIRVNGRKVNIHSFKVKLGDTIEVKKSDKSEALVRGNIEAVKGTHIIPEWLSFDKDALNGEMLRLPERGEIQLPADPQLVVELYSK